MTQICNLSFKLSRYLKDRIEYEKGVLQWSTILILVLSVLMCAGSIYYAIDTGMNPEGIALWLCIAILLVYTYVAESYDAIILNGALMALYLAFLTSVNLKQLNNLNASLDPVGHF